MMLKTENFIKVNYENLDEVVYAQIKQKIIDNQLKPGEKLNVEQLASLLGVSKTPVNHALKSLAKDGYTTIHPRAGSYVRKYSSEEVEAIFDFREVLEVLVVEKSIHHPQKDTLKEYHQRFQELLDIKDAETDIDSFTDAFFSVETEFHEFLTLSCPSIIRTQIHNLIDLSRRFRILHLHYRLEEDEDLTFRKKEVLLHQALTNALLDNDVSSARELIIEDVRRTKKGIIQYFDKIETIHE